MVKNKLEPADVIDLGWEDFKWEDDEGAFTAYKVSHGCEYTMLYTTDDMLSIYDKTMDWNIYRGTCDNLEQFKTLMEWLMIG